MYTALWDVKHLGTVGQWASALLTAGSLYLAFYIILRDRRLRERTQADKVLAMLTYVAHHGLAPKFPVTLTVRNSSGLPLKGPMFVIQDKDPKRAIKDLRGFSLTEERAEQVSEILNEDRPPNNFLVIASLISLDAIVDFEGTATATVTEELELPSACYNFYLFFLDADSRSWCRDLDTYEMWQIKSSIRTRLLAKWFSGYRWHDRRPLS